MLISCDSGLCNCCSSYSAYWKKEIEAQRQSRKDIVPVVDPLLLMGPADTWSLVENLNGLLIYATVPVETMEIKSFEARILMSREKADES